MSFCSSLSLVVFTQKNTKIDFFRRHGAISFQGKIQMRIFFVAVKNKSFNAPPTKCGASNPGWWLVIFRDGRAGESQCDPEIPST
jgi:hypothetical protein